MLRVESVSKRFGGVMALADVSLDVEEGGVVGVIGPNGAGKTTLFNLIAGVERASSGQVVIRGLDGERRTDGSGPDQAARLGIARTFQNIRLFDEMSVVDNVMVGRHIRTTAGFFGCVLGLGPARREEAKSRQAALQLMELVGLACPPEAPAASLSYGDQRRLEIARALASEPRLLLLDEPAAGMNPRETRELADLMDRITDLGVTILLIEHDMRLVMTVCPRLIVLDHGIKIAEGTPGEIKSDKLVINAYLGGGSHA